jgi:hypothetical protein
MSSSHGDFSSTTHEIWSCITKANASCNVINQSTTHVEEPQGPNAKLQVHFLQPFTLAKVMPNSSFMTQIRPNVPRLKQVMPTRGTPHYP